MTLDLDSDAIRLQITLWFHGHPGGWYTLGDLVDEIGYCERTLAAELERLLSQGIVEQAHHGPEPTYRYCQPLIRRSL